MKAVLLLTAVIILSACVSQSSSALVSVGNATIAAEIADSPQEWSIGLMNRSSLPEGSGMLFVFPDEQPRSFWMKNTLIPLDIIFVSSNLTVLDVASAEPCRADPCPIYSSEAPAMYVLEVGAGFAEAHGVKYDDIIEIDL